MSALERLLAEGGVDSAQRPGARSGRDRGAALTERGRHRATILREASDSEVSTNREEARRVRRARPSPRLRSPQMAGNGDTSTTAAIEERAETCSGGDGATVSGIAFPAVAGNGNAAPAEVQQGESGAGGAGHVRRRGWMGMSPVRVPGDTARSGGQPPRTRSGSKGATFGRSRIADGRRLRVEPELERRDRTSRGDGQIAPAGIDPSATRTQPPQPACAQRARGWSVRSLPRRVFPAGRRP